MNEPIRYLAEAQGRMRERMESNGYPKIKKKRPVSIINCQMSPIKTWKLGI